MRSWPRSRPTSRWRRPERRLSASPRAPRRAQAAFEAPADGGSAASQPEKPRFATLAKPSSSSRRASSRCATRSAAGSSSLSPTRTHQQSTRRPPERTKNAPCSPTSQTPSSTALEHQPGRRGQLALVMADEVTEQSERDPLGAGIRAQAPPGAALAADRNHLAGPASRLKPGHRPGVGKADRRRRERPRLDRDQQHCRDRRRSTPPTPSTPSSGARRAAGCARSRPRASEGAPPPRGRRARRRR